jgi:UDP-N-acetylmuramoylalanine--D-glutamate ligase
MKINLLMKQPIITILGFGLEGQAAYDFIRKIDRPKKIKILERKELDNFELKWQSELKRDRNIELHFGLDYLSYLSARDLIIKSPGINPRIPEISRAKRKGAKLTALVNIFLDNIRGKSIGVTGSKGKSTTSSLIYSLLKAGGKKVYLCGNIGRPVIDYLKYDSPETIFVLELSSYQLEDTSRPPDVGVWVSFFSDHLNYHENLKAYFKAKTKISDWRTILVYNKKFKKIDNFYRKNKFYKQAITYNDHLNFIKDDFLFLNNKRRFSLDQIKLLGEHNKENILAATITAELFGIKNNIIQSAIENFSNLEHRLEKVGKVKGIIFYNDSASVTPDSTIEAIKALGQENIDTVILGGQNRDYNFDRLVKLISESQIRNIAFFPDSDRVIFQTIKKMGLVKRYNIKHFNKMDDCVQWCFQITAKDKICLLSPGSPSYLSFKNFCERGDLFKKFIKIKI